MVQDKLTPLSAAIEGDTTLIGQYLQLLKRYYPGSRQANASVSAANERGTIVVRDRTISVVGGGGIILV